MNNFLVLADNADVLPEQDFPVENIHKLSTYGPGANIKFDFNIIPQKLQIDPPKRAIDLLRIAAFVYSADTRIQRGTKFDVFAKNWKRNFTFNIPVEDIDFWNSVDIRELLCDTLNHLTGDYFCFNFTSRSAGPASQLYFDFKDSIETTSKIDTVILFSGGIDSLAAVVESIVGGRHPLLVSHRSAPVISKRQTDLVKALKDRFMGNDFLHISMWLRRVGGQPLREHSQRSRSFLFTSLGIITSASLNISEVRLCDNGVISFNLPRSGQNLGTNLSRSTNPRYLQMMERLAQLVSNNNDMRLVNTLIFRTKVDTMKIISDSGHPELIQEAISCSHTQGPTSFQPHCGTCSQCIDRRFASLGASLEKYDLASRYGKDIFIEELKEGEERTYAENYVRLADKLENIHTAETFLEQFPEIYDSIPKDLIDIGSYISKIYKLHKAHQHNLHGVIDNQVRAHSSDLRRNILPKNSLIKIILNGAHKLDPRIKYLESLSEKLHLGIISIFNTSRLLKIGRD